MQLSENGNKNGHKKVKNNTLLKVFFQDFLTFFSTYYCKLANVNR